MSDLKVRDQGFNLTPQTLDQAMQYAKLISDSDLAPKDYKGKPGNVLVAIQMGQEIGLKPMQAIQNIAVINGRPSVWGDAMLAIVKSHPDFEYVKEDLQNETAYCTLKRRGEEEKTQPFSIDDAKKAGLWNKQGPWSQYPNRMLQMRARSFCCRDVFPDALKGIHCAEESQDLPMEVEVVENQSTNAQKANKLLSVDTVEIPDFEKEFSECESKDLLAELFHRYKKLIKSPTVLSKLVKAKDKRKVEIEELEIKEVAVPSEPINQTDEEWLEAFDKDPTDK